MQPPPFRAQFEDRQVSDFDYFKLFAGAHDLTVNIVTAKAQNTYNVTRDLPSLDLAGIM